MQHSGVQLLKNVVQYLHPGRGASALDIIANFERVVSQSSHVQLPLQNILHSSSSYSI